MCNVCRSSLSPGAAPSLAAAGSALAATFLDTGLATGDTAVLSRLMALLTAPLSQLADQQDSAQEMYAEWVSVRALLALLQVSAEPPATRDLL